MVIIQPNPQWQERFARALTSVGWTVHRPGQGCLGVDHAYKGKQDTSFAASVYISPRTGTQRRKVLEHLQRHGPATDPELQAQLGMRPNSERPRRVELVEGGFVRDSGLRKKHGGKEHIVWEASYG